MKEIEFIKEYSKEHYGAICGSYCLHKLIGCEYGDIDFFTFMPVEFLKQSKYVGKLMFKMELNIMGEPFHLSGHGYNNENSIFVSYRSTNDYLNLNFVFMLTCSDVRCFFPVLDVLHGFDMSILRIAMTPESGFNEVNLILPDARQSLDTKIVKYGPKHELFENWHDPRRLEKYKTKLQGYRFIKEL